MVRLERTEEQCLMVVQEKQKKETVDFLQNYPINTFFNTYARNIFRYRRKNFRNYTNLSLQSCRRSDIIQKNGSQNIPLRGCDAIATSHANE